jgi:hypothetical protein
VIAAQRRVYARHAETIAQVEADHARLLTNIAELRERIAELQSEFEESAQPVFDAVEADLAAELPSADDYGWPEPKDGDEGDDPLYDSSRDYFEQLARYREHQGKPEDAGFKLYDLTETLRPDLQAMRRTVPVTTAARAHVLKKMLETLGPRAGGEVVTASRNPKVTRSLSFGSPPVRGQGRAAA